MNLDEMVADMFMSCCKEQIKERLGVDEIPDNVMVLLNNAVSWKESFVQSDVFDVIWDAASTTVDAVLEEDVEEDTDA